MIKPFFAGLFLLLGGLLLLIWLIVCIGSTAILGAIMSPIMTLIDKCLTTTSKPTKLTEYKYE